MNDQPTEIGVSLHRAKVDYPIYDSNAQVFQRRILNIASFGRFHRKLGSIHVVHALKEISFELRAGSSVGLIGRNGAGKSTMLKLLAGVLEPTSGKISRRGDITALLTVNSGMENEFDGYQNIRRIGLLRGFTAAEIDDMTPEIVEFAEIGDFISLPVRTYSAGMRMRLAFAIATVGTPDILLIDEVFGAGDRWFLTKARRRIGALLERSRSIVLSSHSVGHIREFCTSCLYLEQGEIRAHGETDDVLKVYNEDIKRSRSQPNRVQ
jgi:homopolymeric O-antigen transport system ATP-binding protein